MQNRRNYYRILQVQPDAPAEVIRTSYRTLMQRLKMHPDLGGDHWNATLLNEAFTTLNDPERRALYDSKMSFRERQRGETRAAPVSTPAPDAEPTATPAPEPTRPPTPIQSAAHGLVCPLCEALCARADAKWPITACWRCGSPLGRPDRLDGGPTRRAVQRIPRHMPVRCSVGWPTERKVDGETQNISAHGLRMSSTLELLPGQRVRIECSVCDAVGIVEWVANAPGGWPRRWHVGVEFLSMRVRQNRGTFVRTQA